LKTCGEGPTFKSGGDFSYSHGRAICKDGGDLLTDDGPRLCYEALPLVNLVRKQETRQAGGLDSSFVIPERDWER
jgi:hypothetical protein